MSCSSKCINNGFCHLPFSPYTIILTMFSRSNILNVKLLEVLYQMLRISKLSQRYLVIILPLVYLHWLLSLSQWHKNFKHFGERCCDYVRTSTVPIAEQLSSSKRTAFLEQKTCNKVYTLLDLWDSVLGILDKIDKSQRPLLMKQQS